MTIEEIQKRAKDRVQPVAKEWLAPIDAMMADLLDKAPRMTIGAFFREVERAALSAPSLYPLMNHNALQDELETQSADAIIAALEDHYEGR